MKNIKLSVNAPLHQAALLKEAGFGYIEPSNTDIMNMAPLEFEKAAAELKRLDIACSVIDNPIPCAVSFGDEKWRPEEWRTYLVLSARRAKKLGAAFWCFGNGTSRMLREGDLRTIANFYEAVSLCAEIGKACGIEVIVEPLGPSVTNYLNSVEETAAFLREADLSGLYTMVDYRWEYELKRPEEDLYRYASWIRHAHIDNPSTDYAGQKIRRMPKISDEADYGPFLDFIKSDSFEGILSIEANTFEDFQTDLKEAMDFFHFHGIEGESGRQSR